MRDPRSYDALSAVVFMAGVHEGLIPFLAKIFGWHPPLSLPLQLGTPWWWLVAGSLILVAVVVLELLDRAKKRANGQPSSSSG